LYTIKCLNMVISKITIVVALKTFLTKLPEKDAEKFVDACNRLGKSYYEVLRELIYRWLEEQGVEVEKAPVDVRLSSIEQKLKKLEEEQQKLKEQVEQLMQELEKLSKSGLWGFMGSNKKR